jgi:hypothetical protein
VYCEWILCIPQDWCFVVLLHLHIYRLIVMNVESPNLNVQLLPSNDFPKTDATDTTSPHSNSVRFVGVVMCLSYNNYTDSHRHQPAAALRTMDTIRIMHTIPTDQYQTSVLFTLYLTYSINLPTSVSTTPPPQPSTP